MGQYYIAVNLDKKQFVNPHACGDGAKLMELALGPCGMMACMAILLADGNGRGGGDLYAAKCPKCDGHGTLRRKNGKPRTRNGFPVICPDCRAVGRLPAPKIVGSWAGDRVVLAGDYGDKGKFVVDGSKEGPNLYALVHADDSEYTDVSVEAMKALAGDGYVGKQLKERAEANSWDREMLEPVLAS